MVEEFFPELTPMTRHRTRANCGERMCLNPGHREDYRATRRTLTDDQILAIYAARGEDAGRVAVAHGVGKHAVTDIWHGRRWAHLTGHNLRAKQRT